MSITNFSRSMAFLVLPLLTALVISTATSDHDDQFSTAGFQTTLKHVDHTLVEKLTKTELLLRAIKRGNQRVKQLNSIQTATNELVGSSEYLMHFSIGTPTASPVTAVMDMATSLIWTQCQPCESCFRQSTPVFDPTTSSTYSSLECTSKEQCKSNIVNSECSNGGYCTYHNSYGDGSHTRGTLATETFTFEGAGQVPGIVFGCGVYNKMGFETASGVVGLGPRGLSLVSQMNESRFSYCLPTLGSSKTGVLTMGSRATNPTGSRVRTTPLIMNPNKPEYYYLALQGITIGTKRLPVSSTTFQIQKDGSGGMVIDCGTSVTYLVKTAYDLVAKELSSQVGLRKSYWGYLLGLDLCYNMPSDDVNTTLNKFPVMVFHFENGVDLRLTHENYFFIDYGGIGCLTMLPVRNSDFSVLGNYQQQNTLVVHDIAKGTLSFLPNYPKCSGNKDVQYIYTKGSMHLPTCNNNKLWNNNNNKNNNLLS